VFQCTSGNQWSMTFDEAQGGAGSTSPPLRAIFAGTTAMIGNTGSSAASTGQQPAGGIELRQSLRVILQSRFPMRRSPPRRVVVTTWSAGFQRGAEGPPGTTQAIISATYDWFPSATQRSARPSGPWVAYQAPWLGTLGT